MSRAHVAVAVALLMSFTGSAHSAPSIWQRVVEPRAARGQILQNRIERMMTATLVPGLAQESSDAALAMFLLTDRRWTCAPAGNSPPPAAGDPDAYLTPRFEYLIGEALVDSQSGRQADARCVLERALRDAPDSPLAADGWSDLGLADGLLGDHMAERAAYARAIELSWDTQDRARLYVAIAESDMALGEMKRALREYRIAVEISEQPELLSGAYFGLAIALDRSGDLPSALDAAVHAISVPLPQTLFAAPSVLDLPNVFFTPAYEVHYYRALRAMATARLAKDNDALRDALADAVEEWTAYLIRAEVDRAPWVQSAKNHQASVERQLAKLPVASRRRADAQIADPETL